MHTRNVNVRTAAQESSRKMGENPKLNVLEAGTELAKLEGRLMMGLALTRFGFCDLGSDEQNEEAWMAPIHAAIVVARIISGGPITSPVLYELIRSVESMSLQISPDNWREYHPFMLDPLLVSAQKK